MRRIKRNLLILHALVMILAIALHGSRVLAQSRPGFAAGIMVGEPTGISLKYNNLPVIGLAWSLDNHFHIHCDYWMYNGQLKGPVDWYIGIGGKLRLFNNDSKNRSDEEKNHDFSAGVRVPLGLQYFPIEEVELFGEIVPGISLLPETDFDADYAIGARYYF